MNSDETFVQENIHKKRINSPIRYFWWRTGVRRHLSSSPCRKCTGRRTTRPAGTARCRSRSGCPRAGRRSSERPFLRRIPVFGTPYRIPGKESNECFIFEKWIIYSLSENSEFKFWKCCARSGECSTSLDIFLHFLKECREISTTFHQNWRRKWQHLLGKNLENMKFEKINT